MHRLSPVLATGAAHIAGQEIFAPDTFLYPINSGEIVVSPVR